MMVTLESQFPSFAQSNFADGAAPMHDCVLRTGDGTVLTAARFLLGTYSHFFGTLFRCSQTHTDAIFS